MIYLASVSFGLGIIFEKFFNFGFVGAAHAALLFFVSALIFLRSGDYYKSKQIFIAAIFFVLGIIRVWFGGVEADPMLQSRVGQKISFQAEVVFEPDARDTSVRYIVKPADSHSSILLVSNPYPKFLYGDKIKVEGILNKPKNFESETGDEFDYISYLKKDGIHFEMFRPTLTLLKHQSGARGALFKVKQNFIEGIGKVVPDPEASLLGGLLFGSKQSLGNELLDDFKKAGIVHIVVLSGFNITIVASAFLYLASYLGRKKWGLVAAVAAIFIFGLMVGFQATVVRATVMALIAILARYLGRPFDALRALFIAGFLMVFWNPLILTSDPSFKLSFMATLGLILITPIFYTRLKFVTPKYGLRETIASTLAVQIFLLPLLLQMSGFISLVSFLVNIFIPPLVPGAMLFGFATGLIALLPTKIYLLAWLPGFIAFVLARIVIFTAEFSSSLPFATLAIGKFPTYLVVVSYICYFFIYKKIKVDTLTNGDQH